MHIHDGSVFLCIDGQVGCQTQLNLIDPKEMLENRFSRILRDFDNATICKGVLEEKFGGIKYCAGAAFEKEDW